MSARLRIAVLASGRGSNLAAIVAARAAGMLDIDISGVFSDRATAGALAIAAASGIGHAAMDRKSFADRRAFDEALFAAVDDGRPDLIVCAGFMRILSAEVVAARSQRMINIHPSLLPRYPGLHTHQRVLDAGDAEHGASVHFMTPELDAGPVIAQTRVAVLPGDDADALAARLLPAEHHLLVATLARFVRHRIAHRDGHLLVDDRHAHAWSF